MTTYLPVSKHTTYIKHQILSYYLDCVYRSKLANWGYIETHGGSGICKDKETGTLIDGSPVIVNSNFPDIPMSICEINPERKQMLDNSLKGNANTKIFLGDCNELIDKLHDMQDCVWYFHFIDPDGIRSEEKKPCDQLTYKTLTKIMMWRNSEILLNFPLIPFYRWGSFVLKWPEDKRSLGIYDAFTRFYGGEEWTRFCSDGHWNMEKLVDTFISMRLQPYYRQPLIKYLVRTEKNIPVYYLVFGTNNKLGDLFMGKAFKKAEDVWSKQLSRVIGQVGLESFVSKMCSARSAAEPWHQGSTRKLKQKFSGFGGLMKVRRGLQVSEDLARCYDCGRTDSCFFCDVKMRNRKWSTSAWSVSGN